MITRISLATTALLAVVFAFLCIFAVSPNISAQSSEQKKNLCGGANLSLEQGEDDDGNLARSCGDPDDDDEDSRASRVDRAIAGILNVFSLIISMVAVIFILVGAFKYVTSGGDPSKISGAKNTILYAIIGLIIVALAQFIVKFVLAKLSSS